MTSYNLGTAAGRIVIDGSGAEKGFGVAKAAAGSLTDVLREQMDAADRVANRLLIIGGSGAAAMGLATNSAANFEQRLSAIKAVSGATEEQMKLISEAALRIGADSVYSATESAMAMEELIKAGLSVEDILNGAADATVNLAAAGEVALPRAAEIAANAMNNFNLAGEDMPRIADMIAGAANASAIDVEQFGQSMSQVGAVAALAGVSFDDTAVAIAEMGNAGIKGSDAGTSLKTMLMNLIPTTKAQIAEFQDLGLMTYDSAEAFEMLKTKGLEPASDSLEDARDAVKRYLIEQNGLTEGTQKLEDETDKYLMKNGAMQNAFFDQEGNVRSLRDIQGELAEATAGLTKEQQLASLEILFGADAIRGAAVMAKEGAEGYDTMMEAMSKVTATDVAATRMDNLKGAVEELSGAWETLVIKVGSYFLKPMAAAARAVTRVIDVFTDLPEWVYAGAASILALGTGLSLFLGVVIKVIPILVTLLARFLGLQAISRVWGVFSAGISVLRGGGGIAAAMAAVSTQVASLGGWLGRLLSRSRVFLTMAVWVARFGAVLLGLATGPVGIVVGVLTGLALIGKLLYDKWEPFRNLVNRIGAAIRDWFIPYANMAKDAWEAFVGGLSGEGSGVLGGIAGAAQTLGAGLRGLWDAFQSGESTSSGFVGIMEKIGIVIRGMWDATVELGRVFRDVVWPAIVNVGKEIAGTFMTAVDAVVNTFKSSLLPALQELWATIQNDVVPGIKNLATNIWPVIQAVGKFALILIAGLWTALMKIWSVFATYVLPIMIKVGAFIVKTLIVAIARVGQFIIKYLLTPLVKAATWILGTMIPALVDFGKAVYNAFKTAIEWVADAVGGIIDWFKKLGKGAKDGADAAGSAFSGIVTWIQNAWNTIAAIFSTFFEMLTAPFIAVYNFLQPFLSGLMTFISSLFQVTVAIWTGIFQVAWAVIQVIFEVVTTVIWGLLVNWGRLIRTVWTAIFNFMKSAAQLAWNVITTIFNTAVAVAKAIFEGFKAALEFIWTGIVTAVTTAINAVKAVIDAVLGTIKVLWDTNWALIKGIVDSIWGLIGGSVSNGIEGAKSTISNVMGTIKTAWDTAWDAFLTKIGEIWKSIKEKIDDAIKNVKGAFDGAGEWLKTAGKNIVDGLVQGIKNAAKSAVDAVKGVGDSIVSSFKGVLGIASPSKVMRQLGKWTTEGFTIGLEDDMKQLDRVSKKIGMTVEAGAVADRTGADAATRIKANNSPEAKGDTNLNVTWVAAPNDTINTRTQAKNMLGKATRVVK